MIDKLVIKNKRLRASEISGIHGRASELVASICEALEADQYLTGTGALDYMQADDFKRIDCEVLVQRWQPFTYQQPHGDFVADLSTLDLLLNEPDKAAELIAAAGSWESV
jgi:hypothetical protein